MPTNKESIKFVWEFIASAQHNLIPTHLKTASIFSKLLSIIVHLVAAIWFPSAHLLLGSRPCPFFFFLKLLNNLNKPMLSYHLPSLLHGLPVCLSQPSVHLILIQGFLLLWFCCSLSSGLQARFSLLLPLLSEF